MHPRLAKKIVRRVQNGDVTHTSYGINQVRAAFRVLDKPLTEVHLKPWLDHANRPKDDPEVVAARVVVKKIQKDGRLAALEARRVHRAQRREEAQRNAVALAAAREAFRQSMEGGFEGGTTPEVVIAKHVQVDEPVHEVAEPEPVTTDTPDYEGMTVADLRAIAKDRGISGYSSLKKADLAALLAAS